MSAIFQRLKRKIVVKSVLKAKVTKHVSGLKGLKPGKRPCHYFNLDLFARLKQQINKLSAVIEHL